VELVGFFLDRRMDVGETSKDVVSVMVANKTKGFGNTLIHGEKQRNTNLQW
jgi:hypothetical protein